MSVVEAPTELAGRQPPSVLAPVLEPLRHRIAHERQEAVFQRDPVAVGKHIAGVTRFVNLFSPEVRGVEHLPATGPVLVVGNHSGVYVMPDVWLVALEIVRRRGLERPAYALAYDLLFALPGIGRYLRSIGAIPAGGQEAEAALAQGALLLVYPGGDWEACRPWTERNQVDFGGRHGFVRLALRTGVPVVPVVTHGSHQALVVLSRGDRLARMLGLNRLRIHVMTIVAGPPFGLTVVLGVPMPSAVTVEFLPPLDWSRFGSDAAGDGDAVDRCYGEITSVMQRALDRLAAERSHPIVRGLWNLARHGDRRVDVPPGS